MVLESSKNVITYHSTQGQGQNICTRQRLDGRSFIKVYKLKGQAYLPHQPPCRQEYPHPKLWHIYSCHQLGYGELILSCSVVENDHSSSTQDRYVFSLGLPRRRPQYPFHPSRLDSFS